MNVLFERVYVCVCGRGYISLSVCPIRSSIRQSDQIDGHTNNPGGGRVVQRCWVNFQCLGALLIWITVGQGPIVLAVGAGGVVWTFFSHLPPLFFSPPHWRTARYRLKYCLKRPLSLKQPTN